MNIGELKDYTRSIIGERVENSPSKRVWSDGEIVSFLNRSYSHLYRKQTVKDQALGLVKFNWKPATSPLPVDSGTFLFPEAVQQRTDLYTIYMPSWAYKVVRVEDASKSNNEVLPCRRWNTRSVGWSWSGTNQLMFHDTVAPTNLDIWCYRLPAPMHEGIFSVADSVISIGAVGASLNKEPQAYLGSTFELTSGSSKGVIATCTDYARTNAVATFATPGANVRIANDRAVFVKMLAAKLGRQPGEMVEEALDLLENEYRSL